MKYSQPRVICWLIILIAFVSMYGCAAKTAKQQQGAQVQLNKIETQETDGKTEIAIEGSEPLFSFTSFQLTEPLRLVVDITDANIGKFKDKIPVNNGTIVDITPSQSNNIARLEIALSQAVESKVNQVGGKLVVEIAKPAEALKTASESTVPEPQQEAAPKTETPDLVKTEAAQPEMGAATMVTSIQASAGKDGVNVVILGNGTMKPNSFMVAGKKLVVDIPGVRSRVKPSFIPVRKGGLSKVRVGQHPAPDQKVRVVFDLTKPLDYSVTPQGNSLVIAMYPAGSLKPEAKAEEKNPQERSAQEPEKAPVAEKEIVPAPAPAGTAEATTPVPVQKESVKQKQAPLETAPLPVVSSSKEKRISLDLQDADLVNVMRLFAELADLNIVLAPDVKGKVTVRMVNIPWDQAMDVILKMNGLGRELDGNVLRIATKIELTKQSEEEMRAKEAQKKAEDLITRIIPINYSTATEVEGTIKKSLSARGEIVTDVRTNTIIVKDISRNVDAVVSLVRLLDKPIPQVMIEARIVEATLNFNRSIGIQWGTSYKASGTYGNSSGLGFPNSYSINGGPTMGTTVSGNNYMVNMPTTDSVGGSGGAIGFTFGSLSKALNLDLVLSAMESTGEGKIVSTPRVSALDNKEAKIEQGLKIPYESTSAAGTQTQFVDALLSLKVTPHATPDNKIFLKIEATKNAIDKTTTTSTGVYAIKKNEASTEILLADGETAVIGGILIVDREKQVDKIPFLGDIPLIGWLFTRKTNSETKSELIIFITPKIMKQEGI